MPRHCQDGIDVVQRWLRVVQRLGLEQVQAPGAGAGACAGAGAQGCILEVMQMWWRGGGKVVPDLEIG